MGSARSGPGRYNLGHHRTVKIRFTRHRYVFGISLPSDS